MENPVIDINIANGTWREVREFQSLIENAVRKTVRVANLDLRPNSEVSILLTDDRQMQGLNQHWRDKNKTTNVLSFPADEVAVGQSAGPLLGDIVLAYETVAKEAHQQQKKIENHMSHLVIHGFLHLFGYDHVDDHEALVMEQLETETLAQLGIADPYDEHQSPTE